MAVKQLSDGHPDGVRLGQSATDLVSFYGTAPVARPAVLAAVTTTTAALGATAAYGFATSAQFDALIAAVNTLTANQKTLGLMATT